MPDTLTRWFKNRKYNLPNAWTPWDSSPTVVHLGQYLYCFFTGNRGEGVFYTRANFTNAGAGNWSAPQLCTSSSQKCPFAALYKDKIYLFYHPTNSRKIYYHTFDGSTFSPSQTIGIDADEADNCSPVATAFNNRLYVFWVGSGRDGLWCKTFDGKSWSGQVRCQIEGFGIAENTNPSVVGYKNELYLFYNGSGVNGTWYTKFNGNVWTRAVALRDTVNCSFRPGTSPSAFLISNLLLVLWNGSGSDGSWITCFNGHGWIRQQSLSNALDGDDLSGSSVAQGYSYGNDRIAYRPFIFWTTGSNKLAAVDGPGFAHPPLSEFNAIVDRTNWTSKLAGNKLVSAFTIPGTHDCQTYCGEAKVAPTAQAQARDIVSQLDDGIRYFDLRCDFSKNISLAPESILSDIVYGQPSGDEIINCHGPVSTGMTTKHFLNQICGWLSSHTSEFVLVQVRQENGGDKDVGNAFATAFQKIINANSRYWRLDNSIPTVDQLRGKIQLVRRFKFQGPAMGIDMTDWNNGVEHNTAPKYYIQDNFQPGGGINEKEKSIKDAADRCLNDSQEDKLYINFTSWSEGFNTPFFNVYNMEMNQHIWKSNVSPYLNRNTQVRLGVVLLDFYETPSKLVHDLITLNKDARM